MIKYLMRILASTLYFFRNPVRDIRHLNRKIVSPEAMQRDYIKFDYTSGGYNVANVNFFPKTGYCSIYVEDQLRGRGIGKQILEQVRVKLMEQGIPSVRWHEFGSNPMKTIIPGFQQICIKKHDYQEFGFATAAIDPRIRLVLFEWSAKDKRMVYKQSSLRPDLFK